MKKLLNYILGVFSLSFIPVTLADIGDGYPMMNGGFGYGGAWYSFFPMLIFWLILILLIIFTLKYFFQKGADETPLEILKKRLAKGEITEAEFEKLKKKLGE